MEKANNNLLVSLNDIAEKEAEWLIPERIPAGQITILAGNGGSGKTSLWCELAAAISSGRQSILDQTPPEFHKEKPERVLFFSAEDSLEYTLKARLRKAEANFSNIFSANLKDERFSEIKFNSKLLRELVEQIRPKLLIFDPVQAYIPADMRMSERNAMRACLAPLIGLGEECGATTLVVVHTNKRQGVFGRNRIADSADFWDIARSVLIVGEDAKGQQRYISNEKNNYAEQAETILFNITDGGVEFAGTTDKKDVDFVRESDFSGHDAPQRQDAQEFIVEFLRQGKCPTKELDAACEAAGITKKTVERAKTNLRKRGILGIRGEGYGKTKVFYSYLIEQKQPSL